MFMSFYKRKEFLSISFAEYLKEDFSLFLKYLHPIKG